MSLKHKIGTGLAIGGLVFSTAAQASTRSAVAIPAASAIAVERASADVESENDLFGGGPAFIIAILALAAVIGGIAIAADGDDDPEFDSPG